MSDEHIMSDEQITYIFDATFLSGYHYLYKEGIRFQIPADNIKILDIGNVTVKDIQGNKKIRTWNPIIFPKGTISFRSAKGKVSIEDSTVYNKSNQPRFYGDFDTAISYLPNHMFSIKDNDIHMVMFDELFLADISSFAYQIMIGYNEKIKNCINEYLNNGKFQEVIQNTEGINPHNLLFGESGYPVIGNNDRSGENKIQYLDTLNVYAHSIYQNLVPIIKNWCMTCGIDNLNIKNMVPSDEINSELMDIDEGNIMESQGLAEKFVNNLLIESEKSITPNNIKDTEKLTRVQSDDISGIMSDGLTRDPTELIQYLSFYITYGVCPIIQLEKVMRTYNFIVKIFKEINGTEAKIGTRDVGELDIEYLKEFGGLNDLFFSDESCKNSQRDSSTGLLSSLAYRFSVRILDDIACDFLSEKAKEFGIDGYYSYDQSVPWGPNRDHERNQKFHFHPEICVFNPSEKILNSVPLFNMATNGYSLLPDGIPYYSDGIRKEFLKNTYSNPDIFYNRLLELYTKQMNTKIDIFQSIIQIHYLPVNSFNIKLENNNISISPKILRNSENYPNNLVQNTLLGENTRFGGKNKKLKQKKTKKKKYSKRKKSKK